MILLEIIFKGKRWKTLGGRAASNQKIRDILDSGLVGFPICSSIMQPQVNTQKYPEPKTSDLQYHTGHVKGPHPRIVQTKHTD